VIEVVGQRDKFAVDAHLSLPDALGRGGVPSDGDILAHSKLAARRRVVDPDARTGDGAGDIRPTGAAARRQHGDDGNDADHGNTRGDDEQAIQCSILDPSTKKFIVQSAS
jgi:hypothetical protein